MNTDGTVQLALLERSPRFALLARSRSGFGKECAVVAEAVRQRSMGYDFVILVPSEEARTAFLARWGEFVPAEVVEAPRPRRDDPSRVRIFLDEVFP